MARRVAQHKKKQQLSASAISPRRDGTQHDFVSCEHVLNQQLLLDEGFATIETPARLRNITLFDHQKTIVRALIDLENKRVIEVKDGNRRSKFSDVTRGKLMVETSAVVLSEKFGSGKTIELLALIAEQPVPKAFPIHMNTLCTSETSIHGHGYDRFQHEITRTYTGARAFIRPNFIVVGDAMVDQWREAIESFTDFTLLVVADQRSLKVFTQVFRENKLNSYDIVLVKCGQVTGNLGFLGAKFEDSSYANIISAVGYLLRDHCISRDIWDDFDKIKIPTSTFKFNSLFTIYVSATTAKTSNVNNYKYGSIEDLLTDAVVPLANISRDITLFSNFNIRNVPEYTERSTSLTRIDSYRYVYENPDDNFIRLLGVIGDDATEIGEMLNGDAKKTAAKRLQIEATTAADIFSRVLDQQYEKYRLDQKVLAAVERFKKHISVLTRDPEEALTHTEIEAVRKSLEKGASPHVRAYSVLLAQTVDAVESEFKIALIKDGAAITRVIENVKQGECQICRLELRESDTMIVKCCGLIVCDICGVEGSHLNKHYDIETRTYVLKGKCANCRHDINPRTDLVFVDKNINVEALLGNVDMSTIVDVDVDVDITTPTEPTTTITPEPEPEHEHTMNPKLEALLNICRGIVPKARELAPLTIPQLLIGERDLYIDTPLKILVFANFDETLKTIEDLFVENGIHFMRLHGSYKEKAATVKLFRDEGTVLLVNSSHSCAGLNIQFSTDIVLFHKLIDENVAGQVIGRGQRVGRTSNLRVHMLLYNNEAM